MIIEIAGKHLEITPSLREYAEEKLGSLGKFVEKYDASGGVELKVSLGRVSAHHHKGEVYEAVADLILPKQVLRAEEYSEDAHAAIDIVREKLSREIETYKAKHDE